MQADISSAVSEYNGNTLRSYKGSSNNTKCRWNCKVIDSDFPERWKTAFGKKRLITLVVNYERTALLKRGSRVKGKGQGSRVKGKGRG